MEKDSSSVSTLPSMLLRRFGRKTLFVLLLTFLVEIAIVAWLAFLWASDPSNQLWHSIMVSGWITRAISIPTLFLRTAVDFQSGYVAAMVAGLALESGGSVLLRHAPLISTARADRTRPRKLFLPIVRGAAGRYLKNTFNLGTLTLLCFTTLALQFSSTVLLSDLHLGQMPGLNLTRTATYDFAYEPERYLGILPSGWAHWFNVRSRFPQHSRNSR